MTLYSAWTLLGCCSNWEHGVVAMLSRSQILSDGVVVHWLVTDFLYVSLEESLVLLVKLVLSLSSPDESVVSFAT